MDPEKCSALLKVLEVGNLSKAAGLLGYTPSGISRMMATLEQELGFPLLFRSKAGVAPTPECTRMLPALKELAAAGRTCRQMAEHIRGLETGTVRVGSAYRQFYGILAQILSEFGRQHPGIHVDIRMENSTPLLQRLAAHETDFCIVSRHEGDYLWTPLLVDDMVAALPLDHPLARAQAPAYPIARLEDDPFVEVFPGQDSDNARTLAQAQVKPNVHFSVFDTLAASELVGAGLGVSLMNRIYAREFLGKLYVLPLEPRTTVEIGIALPNDTVLSPAVSAFCDFAVPRLTAFARALAERCAREIGPADDTPAGSPQE
ncbi:MAG: LysR family transcriptional regulator [Eggerthellaceae bacterium]|jgi:DNA-binding transcriptional LysR family regulator